MIDSLKTHIENSKKELAETEKAKEIFLKENGVKSRFDRETREVRVTKEGFFASLIPEHMDWLRKMHRVGKGAYRLIAKPEEVIVTVDKKDAGQQELRQIEGEEEDEEPAEPQVSEEAEQAEPEKDEAVKATSIPVSKGVFSQVVARLEALKTYIAGDAAQRQRAEAGQETVKKIVEDDERFYTSVVSRFDVWAELE